MTREEAIDIIRKNIPHLGIGAAEMTDALTELVPELRESKDERIRKAIVNLFEVASEAYLIEATGFKKEQFLSYLEKQKEHGPLTKEEEYTLQRIIEYLEDETCPPEWISLLHDIYCLPYEKQKEQKPALEQTLDAYKISDERATAKMEGRIEGRQDVINNPEEYGLQKPAGWSEEDEKIIDTIVSVLGQYIDYKAVSGTGTGYATPRYSKEIDWLKSLRLRPSWKPSEEEMKALDVACSGKLLYGEIYLNGLRRIREQLKKL